jgi:fumarate reductase subunit D
MDGAGVDLGSVRIDRALTADVRMALRSGPIRVFLGLDLLAAAVFMARRGADQISTVTLVWLGLLVLAFFAWWAGRHRLAHPQADLVRDPAPRTLFAGVAAAGMVVWSFDIHMAAGFVLFACGLGGWLWSAWRGGGWKGAGAILTRDPRPFVPLLLLIAVPKVAFAGPAFLVGSLLALPSGIGQELLFLIGLFAPLEALRRRTDGAAVAAALIFALVHVPLVLDVNGGDIAASLANVMLFQAGVGLIACLAFVRHRAVVPIGVAHAIALA